MNVEDGGMMTNETDGVSELLHLRSSFFSSFRIGKKKPGFLAVTGRRVEGGID
jgi:hypothetical protein